MSAVSKNPEKKNIVVVDDEKEITDLYHELLESHYNVIEFNNPEDFLSYLKFHSKVPFHALVTDFKMPKLNGMQMIQKAFEMGFRFPFIMLSGHLDKQTVIQAVEYGAFRLLEKPTTSETLYEAIDQIVIEHDTELVRDEIRKLTSQLRENYSFLRILLLNHIPEDELNKMVIQTNADGEVVMQHSFEHLMESLEARLDDLLNTEQTLELIRNNKIKKKVTKAA